MHTTRSARLRFHTEPPNPDPNATPDGTPGPVSMSQADLDALIGRRAAEAARQAKKAAEDALTAKLGDRSLDDLIAAAEAARAADDAKKSDADKALEAANTAKAEAAKDRAQAKAELYTTRVHAALLAAGVPEAGVSSVNVPDVTVESTVDEIRDAVAKLKTTLPGLFTSKAAAPSDPGNPPAPKDHTGEFGAGGKAEYERRHPAPTA